MLIELLEHIFFRKELLKTTKNRKNWTKFLNHLQTHILILIDLYLCFFRKKFS